jgi:hypothetical protein
LIARRLERTVSIERQGTDVKTFDCLHTLLELTAPAFSGTADILPESMGSRVSMVAHL